MRLVPLYVIAAAVVGGFIILVIGLVLYRIVDRVIQVSK